MGSVKEAAEEGFAHATGVQYTSVTPCLMHDSRSKKGTVFVPKQGKKTCKGTD